MQGESPLTNVIDMKSEEFQPQRDARFARVGSGSSTPGDL